MLSPRARGTLEIPETRIHHHVPFLHCHDAAFKFRIFNGAGGERRGNAARALLAVLRRLLHYSDLSREEYRVEF